MEELGKRAQAYGMKLIEVDGQDVEVVYLATLAAREHALSGMGPVLLHLRTHRLTGHYVGDPQIYRDKEELKRERETKDPVELLRARLELSDEDFAAIDAEVTAAVEAAVEFANAGTDLANGASLYGWASYQNRDARSAGFFRRALDDRNVIVARGKIMADHIPKIIPALAWYRPFEP